MKCDVLWVSFLDMLLDSCQEWLFGSRVEHVSRNLELHTRIGNIGWGWVGSHKEGKLSLTGGFLESPRNGERDKKTSPCKWSAIGLGMRLWKWNFRTERIVKIAYLIPYLEWPVGFQELPALGVGGWDKPMKWGNHSFFFLWIFTFVLLIFILMSFQIIFVYIDGTKSVSVILKMQYSRKRLN